MLAKYTSREFLTAAILAIVGVVRLFTAINDSTVQQVIAAAVAIVPVLAYVIMRSYQKANGVK